jgi:type IV pilus assembly protein PilN
VDNENRRKHFITGLDFRQPVRAVCLENLPDNRFFVRSYETKDALAQLSCAASSVIIAFPDSQILPLSPMLTSTVLWDKRDGKGVMFPKEKADKILRLLRTQQLKIKAIDIESEAIFRGLYLLCEVKNKPIAILYSDKSTVWISVFADQHKIFFYQENLQDNNKEVIIQRGLKLFETQLPKIIIETSYAVGECADEISHLGKIVDITQKLDFEPALDQARFKAENTQWLLACGLSLWNEKSGWNLLPWRETQKHDNKKNFFIFLLKIFLYGAFAVLLLHGLLSTAVYFQHRKNTIAEEKIARLNIQAQPVNQIIQKNAVLNLQLQRLERLSDPQTAEVKFLDSINHSLPEGIFLNSLKLDGKNIFLTGRAETEASVELFISRLKQNTFFAGIQLKHIPPPVSARLLPVDFEVNMRIA